MGGAANSNSAAGAIDIYLDLGPVVKIHKLLARARVLTVSSSDFVPIDITHVNEIAKNIRLEEARELDQLDDMQADLDMAEAGAAQAEAQR